MTRGVKLLYVGIVVLAALGLYYIALTQPFFPFDSQVDSQTGRPRVVQIRDEQAAASLQPGDLIVSLNRLPLSQCRYLFWSPLVGKHPGDTLPITALRDGDVVSTRIVLTSPASSDYPYLLVVIMVSTLFIASGLLITVSPESHGLQPRFQLGLLGILGGFIILATGSLTGYRAPGAFLYPLGLPAWSFLAIMTHRKWPVDQASAPAIKVLFYGTIILATIAILLQLTNNTEILCLSDTAARWAEWSLLLVAIIGLLDLVVPLLRAFGQTQNPYQRAQIRTILWSVGIGLGVPIFTSMLPDIAGLQTPIQPGFVLGIAVVIPVSYVVVAYESVLIRIERYTAFVLFSVFVVVAWFALSSFAVWVTYRLWRGQPDILMISLFTLIPAFVFTTTVRDFARRFVNFILYGNSWHYEQHLESATRDLVRQMEGLPTIAQIRGGLLQDLTSVLQIAAAALWLSDERTGQIDLAGTFGLPDKTGARLPITFDGEWLNAVNYSRIGNVIVFHDLNRMGDTSWHAALQFWANDTLFGVLLLGPKLNKRPYSPVEISMLETITYWAGDSLLTRQLFEANLAQEHRTAALILEHEENIRQQIVATLHDEGLTHLGRVKNELASQKVNQSSIDSLQDVIDRIREIVRRDVIPSEPLKGLVEALESYCIERRMEGFTVTTSYAEKDRKKWRQLDQQTWRALYYATREAIENAIKADPEAPIKVLFEIDDTEYRIVVNDQGPGFDPSAVREGSETHYGLAVMRTRMAAVEGSLSIQSDVGVGTSVSLTGPIRPLSVKGNDDAGSG